ncbi:hypothetical protein RE474_07265 [Methanolobus sediminis]|uniref:Uncharacterized protein n=1 Tax=Methanolobus sediminis TaxID=3072978 RepID=A0AA51UI37_9EURY|nr:hypothetical protein [Methanolobus sediminis]WMW23904.1 hypothetical protein RE474_07265 [Methanolobus sediminis]
MKQELVRILRDIFISAGYDMSESFRFDLIAEKDGSKTFIKLSYNPDLEDIRDFKGQVTEGQALYILAGEVTNSFLLNARDIGLTVWTRDDMAVRIGRAILADMEGTTKDLQLLDGLCTKKPASSSVDEVAKEAINAIFGTGSSPHVEEKALEESLASRPPRSPFIPDEKPMEVQYYRPRAAPPSVEMTPEGSYVSEAFDEPEVKTEEEFIQEPLPVLEKPATQEPVVMSLHSPPVNISVDKAYSLAAPHIRGANAAILKFVPFWMYSYSLNVEHRYRSKIIDISGDGSGYLNALNGNQEEMRLQNIQKTVAVPNVEYDVKMPAITEEETTKKLLEDVIEEYTRDLRFDNTQGDAIISEHKRFKPAASDINLSVELVYVPVWEVKGQRNSVEINASSGEVLRNPVDDDVEFV